MNIKNLPTTVFFLILSGCASTPDYAGFEQRAIDRSPTVSENHSQWKPFLAYSIDSASQAEFYPFRWEHGFSDRVTLVWMPLPLQLRALLWRGESAWVTTEFAVLGPVQSRLKDFHWWPSLSFAFQKSITSDLAWGGKLYFQPEFKRGASTRKSSSTLELETSALYQASDAFYAGFSLSLLVENGDLRARYLGRVPEPVTTATRFPIGVRAGYAFSRAWELELEAEIYRLGYPSSFSSIPVFLSVAHTW